MGSKIISKSVICESPLCSVRFDQNGMGISAKRFCSDPCKQQASLIRRVMRLLKDIPDKRALEIVRGKP
jgi:hypothetical protein